MVIEEIGEKVETYPDVIESVLGSCTWHFLPQRPALSCFDQINSWVRENRGGKRQNVPKELLIELKVAAAILPLIRVDLAMPWSENVTMTDASEQGGGEVITTASLKEIRREAQFALRSGWVTFTEATAMKVWHMEKRCSTKTKAK